MQDIQYITGFTAGELTPWLSTRFDLQAYRRGAALLSNFEVQPYGGIKRRHGSAYVGAAAEQSGALRLVPFHFSRSDSLMLELYPGGMRVYRDGCLLTDADGVPYVLATPWSTAEEVGALRFTQINDVVYVTGPHRPPYRLARTADTEWSCTEMYPNPFPRETYLLQTAELRVLPETNGVYASLESETPAPPFTPEMVRHEYVLTDVTVPSRTYFLNESFSVQAIDTPDLSTATVSYGTICREYDAACKLYYYYTCYTTYEPKLFNGSKSAKDYPDCFLPGALRLAEGGKPYEICGDWEVRTSGEWNAVWELWRSYDTVATHPDCLFWQWTRIRTFDQTAYAERQNWAVSGAEPEPCRMVLVCRASASADLGAHIFFRSQGGTREYRWKIIYYFDERRVRAQNCSYYAEPCPTFRTRQWSFGAFGNRNGYPSFSGVHQGRLWLGGIRGLPTTLFASTVGDFHNFRVGSAADSALHLTLATDNQSGICWIYPARNLLVGTTESEWTLAAADGAALSATNAAFVRQSSVGSENYAADGVENTVLYVQRGGKRMREISYKLEADGFTSTDTSLLAEHLFRSGIREWVVQRGRSTRVWVLMQDATLAVLTTNPEQQVTAWQRVQMPGRRVLHLAALPAVNGADDEVWFVCRNLISGFVSIERIVAGAPYADGLLQLEPNELGVYQAPHLAGSTAWVLPDSPGREAVMVCIDENGQFTHTATIPFTLGCPYRSELQTMPYESERSFNSVRQEGRVRLRLLESSPAFYYRATCAEDWEYADPQRQALVYPYTGSIRVSQMPIPRVGQGFALYVDGLQDFCLLSVSLEFDFHGK